MGDRDKCIKCGAECCRTVGMDIDAPKTKKDWEYIKWYLFHEGVEVYKTKDGSWTVEFKAKCRHLNKDKTCAIYGDRPAVCREYSEMECDSCDAVPLHFETPEDVDEHLSRLKK